MAIDARIQFVQIGEQGQGALRLIDRPSKTGTPGIRGQNSLYFEKAPEEVTALNGLDIWGGSSFIMLGDVEIAKRTGYTSIEFVDSETFKAAVAKYHSKSRT